MHSKTFAQAQDFRALFILLDARQTLWGSQKCYTAEELKTLINRVRTQNPAVHLPLAVIPKTDGLRQRVQELIDAEAVTHAQSGSNRGAITRYSKTYKTALVTQQSK